MFSNCWILIIGIVIKKFKLCLEILSTFHYFIWRILWEKFKNLQTFQCKNSVQIMARVKKEVWKKLANTGLIFIFSIRKNLFELAEFRNERVNKMIKRFTLYARNWWKKFLICISWTVGYFKWRLLFFLIIFIRTHHSAVCAELQV